jgi:hypothetical protein
VHLDQVIAAPNKVSHLTGQSPSKFHTHPEIEIPEKEKGKENESKKRFAKGRAELYSKVETYAFVIMWAWNIISSSSQFLLSESFLSAGRCIFQLERSVSSLSTVSLSG